MSVVARSMICTMVLGGLAASAGGAPVFEPFDFSNAHNFRLQDLHSNFPEGLIELGGVPFDIPKNTPNNIWLADPSFSSSDPIILDIPIGVFGVMEVHSLISTIWGVADISLLTIEFFGEGGGDGPSIGDPYHRVDLVGNDDIREYLQGANTNEINGESTVEVFLSNNGQKRMDKVAITLPNSFHNTTLLSIRVTDLGGVGVQRTVLSGITLGVIPAPGSIVVLAGGLMAATRRRR